MSAAVVSLDPFVPGTESAVAELRREAVSAIVRQQQVGNELAAIRTRATDVEQQAARALARGEELLGRQILARGLLTLETRDALEAELAECRARVAHLLTTMVSAENRTWQATGRAALFRK